MESGNSMNKNCDNCDGSGIVVESPEGTTCKEWVECKKCDGKGVIND